MEGKFSYPGNLARNMLMISRTSVKVPVIEKGLMFLNFSPRKGFLINAPRTLGAVFSMDSFFLLLLLDRFMY